MSCHLGDIPEEEDDCLDDTLLQLPLSSDMALAVDDLLDGPEHLTGASVAHASQSHPGGRKLCPYKGNLTHVSISWWTCVGTRMDHSEQAVGTYLVIERSSRD